MNRNRSKATVAQLNCLSDYMKKHPEMAKGRISNSLQGRVEIEKLWINLSNKLNSLGGPIKTHTKWKQTWRDLKNNEKRKNAQNKNDINTHESNSAGNSSPTIKNESDVEEHITFLDPETIYGQKKIDLSEPDLRILNASPSDNEDITIKSSTLEPSDMQPLTGHQTKPQSKKSYHVASRYESFINQLLDLEKQKVLIERERNVIFEKKNAAIIRVGDVLQGISDKLEQFT